MKRENDKVSPHNGNDFCTGEAEEWGGESRNKGGQTHWLAEEERSGKRDRENRRKSDSWLCLTLLLYIRREGLSSQPGCCFLPSLRSVYFMDCSLTQTQSVVPLLLNLIRNRCGPIKKIMCVCFPRISGTFGFCMINHHWLMGDSKEPYVSRSLCQILISGKMWI